MKPQKPPMYEWEREEFEASQRRRFWRYVVACAYLSGTCMVGSGFAVFLGWYAISHIRHIEAVLPGLH